MEEKSPVLILDDDYEDMELIKDAIAQINVDRPVLFFSQSKDLIQHIKTSPAPPFIIICDVRLQVEDGFDVRKKIADDEDLKYKSMPFIFWSGAALDTQIRKAYDLLAQGFFIKPNDFGKLCEALYVIIQYWEFSKHPKSVL